MDIGKRIKRLRELKKLTQLQLAESLHVTDKAVSKWEQGNADPSIDIIIALSDFFDVTTDYLLKGEDIDNEGTYKKEMYSIFLNFAFYIVPFSLKAKEKRRLESYLDRFEDFEIISAITTCLENNNKMLKDYSEVIEKVDKVCSFLDEKERPTLDLKLFRLSLIIANNTHKNKDLNISNTYVKLDVIQDLTKQVMELHKELDTEDKQISYVNGLIEAAKKDKTYYDQYISRCKKEINEANKKNKKDLTNK